MEQPNVLKRLNIWFRRHVLCDATIRQIFYRILAAQAQGGVRLLTICETCQQAKSLAEPIQELGLMGTRALKAGEPVADGWERTHYLSPEEIGMLRVAEQQNAVEAMSRELAENQTSTRSLFRGVIAPSLYLLFPCLVVVLLTLASPVYIAQITGDVTKAEQVFLYQLAMVLRDYGAVALAVLIGLIVMIAYGRSRWVGTARRLLGPFSRDWLMNFGLQYCRLAGRMSHYGATHLETIAAFRQCTLARYADRVLPQVERDLRDGAAWPVSLRQRILTEEHADMLDSLVPGEARAAYAPAFQVLADMQEALLDLHYTRWARVLKFFLMLFAGLGIVNLLVGLMQSANLIMSELSF